MSIINILILVLAISYLITYVSNNSSNEFNRLVSFSIMVFSLAITVFLLMMQFLSIFGDNDVEESDSSDNTNDSDSDEYEPPTCQYCGNSDKWLFSGLTGINPNGKQADLYHMCLCKSGDDGFESNKNRSSYLQMTPEFFDTFDGSELESRYNEIKDVVTFVEQPYFCDHPGCNTQIDAVGCVFQDIYITLYVDGSCKMETYKNDEQKLVKRDFCKIHKEDGEHTFVVCSFDRVFVEMMELESMSQDTQETNQNLDQNSDKNSNENDDDSQNSIGKTTTILLGDSPTQSSDEAESEND